MASRLKQVSASSKVADGNLWLKSVTLTAGAGAAATVAVDDSTDGNGTDLLTLAAPQGTSITWQAGDPGGVFFGAALYATLTGAGAVVSCEYEQG